MKTLYKFIALFCASSVFAGTEYDFSKGIDLSGKTSVTPYQLNALVDAASVRTNKGLIIVQSTTPDTANNPRYTNFIWLDTSFQPPVIKVWATNTWLSAVLSAGSVNTATITDNAVTSAKLATNAVQTYHLNDNSITDAKIAAGQITSSKFANQSITREKIYPATISSTELTNSAVNTTNIADLAVTASKLVDSIITSSKITGSAVQSTNIAGSAIQTTNIAPSAITSGLIASQAVQTTNIASGSITTNELSASIRAILPVAYARWSINGSAISLLQNQGFSSVTRNAAGDYTLTYSNARSSTNYMVSFTRQAQYTASFDYEAQVLPGTSTITVKTFNSADFNGYLFIYPEQ